MNDEKKERDAAAKNYAWDGACKSDHIYDAQSWADGYDAARAKYEAILSEERARFDRLQKQYENKIAYDRSKVFLWGTDGCTNCETGRITLFAHSGHCIECLHKSQPTEDKSGVMK